MDEEMLGKRDAFRAYLNRSELPLYISVDKDVLDPFWATTNWDQGNARLTDIVDCLRDACSLRNVIGVDICGENPEEMESREDAGAGRNDRTNGEILEALLTYV